MAASVCLFCDIKETENVVFLRIVVNRRVATFADVMRAENNKTLHRFLMDIHRIHKYLIY